MDKNLQTITTYNDYYSDCVWKKNDSVLVFADISKG